MRGKPDSGVFCRVRCFRHVGPALLCAIFLLCSFDMRADAEEIESPSAASHNIDTVLLLDSSGSMRRTDPGRLRDQGVEFILQFLKTGDRLAIIEFADAPHVVRDLVVYDSSQLENVRKEVSSITNSGIYTDLFLGLEKARDVFQANANELNERVVVVISDGQMDPDPGVSTPFDRVQQLDQSILPSLKSLGVKIHTLALGDAADRKLLSRISAETDGLAVFAQSAEAIQKSLAELFISVKKPQVITMETRGFPIDKGVEEATFYINRQEPGDIVLLDPDERPLTYEDHPENMNWYKSEQFDVITVERPADGYWTAQGLTSPENFATVLTNLRLMADFPSGNINSGDEVLLQARFFESRKPVSLPEFTGVVSYTYSVTPTDKISEPTHKGELHDDGEHGDIIPKDGVFSSLIRIDETGEYKLTVTARGPTFLRQQQVPFRVRPRIVSLSVVNEDEIGHEESGHDPVANEEEDEHASNSENDVFVVDLSPETTNFKSKQVKLRAKDEEQRIYILPLEPVLGNRQQYTARATLLPKEGDYVLSVIFSGIGKDKRRLTRESNELQYRYQVGESVPKVEVLTVAKEEVKVEKKKVSATAPIFLLSLLNLGVGATLVFMLKKEVAGITVTVEQYQAPESIITSVAQVRARAALKEIRFDDPLFSDDNIARIKDRKPLDLSNIDLSAAQALAESRGEIVPPSPVADAVEVEDSDPNEQIDSSEADDTQTGESESDEDGGDEADGSDSEGVDQEEETDSDSAEEEFEEDTQEEEEEEPDS